MKNIKRVAVTGASGGLGRALALRYAAPGISLFICGRNEEALSKTEALATEKGAKVSSSRFDIREREPLEAFARLFAGQREEKEDAGESGEGKGEEKAGGKGGSLLFANAGVCHGTYEDGLEDPDELEASFDVNGKAACLTALLCAKEMAKSRLKGQIAVIASQAARIPLVWTPSYSASKAAARSYALSLREAMRPFGIEVTAVCPGFIKSPMQKTFSGAPMPGIVTAEEAASTIAEKLLKNPRIISFPFSLNFLLRAQSLLPGPIYSKMLKKFSFKVEKGKAGGSGEKEPKPEERSRKSEETE